uniref:Uncharacterized protein n=1 Tax=Anopheles stephensi TaxID=30069 RepID=A0A182YN54_ANOST
MVSKKLTYADEETKPNGKGQLPLITTTDRDSNGGKGGSKKSYEQMIIDTIAENDPRRKGLSFVSIKKTIKGKYTIEGEISAYVKKAFEKLTSKDIVERVTGGSGMNGSIRFTKAYTEGVKKQQKVDTIKPKPKAPKAKEKSKTEPKPVKDKNNNEKKKGSKVTGGKAKQAAPNAKLSTKKTAITKTKIARSGGKVRLSIVTPGTASKKTSTKAKLNASKTSAGTKSANKNGRPKEMVANAPKPKPVRERNERK